jgi:hypothetical protein
MNKSFVHKYLYFMYHTECVCYMSTCILCIILSVCVTLVFLLMLSGLFPYVTLCLIARCRSIRYLILVFVLFSSMCEQKVSTYMPSWALLVMTVVCKEVREKTVKVLTRIKQELNDNMSIKTKTKNK